MSTNTVKTFQSILHGATHIVNPSSISEQLIKEEMNGAHSRITYYNKTFPAQYLYLMMWVMNAT